jgi:hypothetical protein
MMLVFPKLPAAGRDEHSLMSAIRQGNTHFDGSHVFCQLRILTFVEISTKSKRHRFRKLPSLLHGTKTKSAAKFLRSLAALSPQGS